MCLGPDAPKPVAPIPAQPAPPVAVLGAAEDNSTASSLAASRGRSSLRIDRTQNAPGSAGSGLNIPT